MKPISDFISPKAILPELKSEDREGALGELSQLLSTAYPELSAKLVYDLLLAREELCSTAMDYGIAIPHAKVGDISNIHGAFAKSTNGVDFGLSTGEKTHIFFVLISPEKSASAHLMALAQISRNFQSEEYRNKIMTLSTKKELFAHLCNPK